MLDRQTWRRSQREIREGRAPRRLADRLDPQATRYGLPCSGAAWLARRVALAASVVLLVIASTVVHSDDYGAREAASVCLGHADDSFRISGFDGVYRASMSGFSPAAHRRF
jgi:hypothetical protein